MQTWQTHWMLNDDVKNIVRPSAVYLDALYYTPDKNPWETEFHSLVTIWREENTEERIQKQPMFIAVRNMFKKFGVDPTKYRPSSEALVRRVLREGSLPFIHPCVALNNWSSLNSLIPIGCYDPDQLGPTLTIRLGRPGESFTSLRNQVFHSEGRLVLADNGPCGSPIVDSIRTSLRQDSRACLYLLFAPFESDEHTIIDAIRTLVEAAQQFHVGRPAQIWLYRPEQDRFDMLFPQDLFALP